MNNVGKKNNVFFPIREETSCTFKSGSLNIYLSKLRINPLAYTAACEAVGLAGSINTQPAVRQNSETNPTSQHNRDVY